MAGARIREKNSFINDPRNYLFRHYVNIVRIVKPKIFLLENVKGILSKDNGAIFKEIVNTFSNPEIFDGDKYYLHYKICKAVEFGVPKLRERVVVIGVLNNNYDIDNVFDSARLKIADIDPHFFDNVTLRDAISDLGEPTLNGYVVLSPCRSI